MDVYNLIDDKSLHTKNDSEWNVLKVVCHPILLSIFYHILIVIYFIISNTQGWNGPAWYKPSSTPGPHSYLWFGPRLPLSGHFLNWTLIVKFNSFLIILVCLKKMYGLLINFAPWTKKASPPLVIRFKQ